MRRWLQTEAVRNTGANACTQSLVTGMGQVDRVLATWPAGGNGKFKAVVKPCSGAGSDGVTICNSHQEVRAAFLKLDGTRNVLGLTTYEVLIQAKGASPCRHCHSPLSLRAGPCARGRRSDCPSGRRRHSTTVVLLYCMIFYDLLR